MSPEALQSLFALLIGFGIAGLISTGVQLLTHQPLSFALLRQGPTLRAFAALPALTFAAPFIIMRATVRTPRVAPRRFRTAMLATIVAGFWSLMSGTVVVSALHTLGVIGTL